MTNVLITLYMGVLFYLLTPKIILSFPKNGSPIIIALAHTIIFGIVLKITEIIIKYLTIEPFWFNQVSGVSFGPLKITPGLQAPTPQIIAPPLMPTSPPLLQSSSPLSYAVANLARPGPNNSPNIIFTNIETTIDSRQYCKITGYVFCYPDDGRWMWDILVQNQGGQLNGPKNVKSGPFTLNVRSNVAYKPGNYIFGFAPAYNGNSMWARMGYGYWDTNPNEYKSTVAFNMTVPAINPPTNLPWTNPNNQWLSLP